jgi:hypothetical protein
MFQAGAKSCCNKAGQCERPTKTVPAKECKQMPLELQAFASAHAELTVAVLTPAAVVPAPAAPALSFEVHRRTAMVEYSPPDRNVLNSTFLI